MEALRKRLVARILDGDGHARVAERSAAFERTSDHPLFAKVADHAWRVSDADLAGAKQSMSEDEIFELTVCAAVGQATRQLDAGLAAVAAAFDEEPS